MLLGDQVYADKTVGQGQAASCGAAARPATTARTTRWCRFDEYTKLYLESWRDPEVRWLLSTVPSVMIFDDHEIIDDWNTSASWRADMAAQPWWRERIAAGLASYWVYQHLGNLSPDELAADPLYQKVTAADDATDAAARVRALGRQAESAENTDRPYQWSFAARPRPDPAGHAGQPLQPGARPRAAGRCCPPPSGTGSSTRPTATTTTWSSARRCPG